jgi:glycosyltransferase involved in cell wall biosynthesis
VWCVPCVGIGDYVAQPAPVQQTTSNASSTDNPPAFSVSANAVIVNIATPEAIADAVLFLGDNPALRADLGRAGRQTVLDYFTVDRQMEQYSVLYAELTGLDL